MSIHIRYAVFGINSNHLQYRKYEVSEPHSKIAIYYHTDPSHFFSIHLLSFNYSVYAIISRSENHFPSSSLISFSSTNVFVPLDMVTQFRNLNISLKWNEHLFTIPINQNSRASSSGTRTNLYKHFRSCNSFHLTLPCCLYAYCLRHSLFFFLILIFGKILFIAFFSSAVRHEGINAEWNWKEQDSDKKKKVAKKPRRIYPVTTH